MVARAKALVFIAAGFFAAAGTAGPARCSVLPKHAPSIQALSPSEMEAKLLEAVNTERRLRGLKELLRSNALDAAARAHAADMAARGVVSHLSSDGKALALRLRRQDVFFSEAGENVAHSETFDVGIIHDSLMQSPEHRMTILGPEFDRAGFGVVGDLDSGYYVVEDFTAELIPRPADDVRAEMRRLVDRFRAERNLPPLPPAAAHDAFADSLAGKKAAGQPEPGIPPEMGSVRVVIIQTSAVDKISASNLNAATRPCDGLAVGVAFGSDDEHPGGGYTLILIFLLPNRISNQMPK